MKTTTISPPLPIPSPLESFRLSLDSVRDSNPDSVRFPQYLRREYFYHGIAVIYQSWATSRICPRYRERLNRLCLPLIWSNVQPSAIIHGWPSLELPRQYFATKSRLSTGIRSSKFGSYVQPLQSVGVDVNLGVFPRRHSAG